MTNDEIGRQLVDRLNAAITAAGVPEDSGGALVREDDMERAVALHTGLPAEVVRNLVGILADLGMHGLQLGANCQQSFGGVATQAMLLGAFAAGIES